MPLYERRCSNPDCGVIEEKIQPASEAHLPGICSRCGHPSERVLSPCSFVIPGFKNGERITEDSLLEGKV